MKIKEITVSVKHTINLGDYSNETLECTMTAELEANDTLDGVQGYLFSRCRNAIAEELANQITLSISPNNTNDLKTALGKNPPQSVSRQWDWLTRYTPYILEERFGESDDNEALDLPL